MNEMSKMEKNVERVTGVLNSFTFNPEEFCKVMCNEHRTLQQSFTGLCIEWIKTCARDDYRTDGRNEHSHNISKEIVTAYDHNHTETSEEHFQDIYIPMI